MNFTFDFLGEESESTVMVVDNQNSLIQHPCKLIPLPDSLSNGSVIPSCEIVTEYTTLQKTLLHYHSGIDKDSDVISGQYEGGYKVWECSIDLVNYLHEQVKIDSILCRTIVNSRVLELGCGHGFPGIVALGLGCQSAVFSDLNEEVLVESTWPNICVNCPQLINRIECYSGDWLSVSEHLLQSDGMFDLILSAETLYTVDSCAKMFHMIKAHLSPNGTALIASKRFYFGVGGGTMELSNLVEKNSDIYGSNSNSARQLTFEVVKEFMDGSSNIREIVMLRWK